MALTAEDHLVGAVRRGAQLRRLRGVDFRARRLGRDRRSRPGSDALVPPVQQTQRAREEAYTGEFSHGDVVRRMRTKEALEPSTR